MMEGLIRTAGLYGLIVFLVYIAYSFYDKSENISIGLLIVGILLAIYVVLSEISIKKEKHEYNIDKKGTRRRQF